MFQSFVHHPPSISQQQQKKKKMNKRNEGTSVVGSGIKVRLAMRYKCKDWLIRDVIADKEVLS